MKILLAIQATGNGHISRAQAIYPILQKYGEVDVLLSGTQSSVAQSFPVKYHLKGLSFIIGKKGGVDLVRSFFHFDWWQFFKNVFYFPVQEYDLIINDFEPVVAWACKWRKKTCYGLSHQEAVANPLSPKPSGDYAISQWILKHYAPTTYAFGFHFKAYDAHIFTPIIRPKVRNLQSINAGHYTVYLPSYNHHHLANFLNQFSEVHWHVFSKDAGVNFYFNNVTIYPVGDDAFLLSMASSNGVLCGAGFEAPAEALYLKKKLAVVPMKNQYEQYCNAAALAEMGVPVWFDLFQEKAALAKWIVSPQCIEVDYPEQTHEIISLIVSNNKFNYLEPFAIHA